LLLPDGSIMTESSAMLLYLGDAFPNAGLAPAIGTAQRAQYLRWMEFLATTLYMSDLRLYYPHKYTVDPAGTEGIKSKAAADMDNEFGILSLALGNNPFLLGARMSAVDIYAAMLINWGPDLAALGAKHPNLKSLHDRVSSRPAIAPVWERNKMA
jgi:glutathione S-transferase